MQKLSKTTLLRYNWKKLKLKFVSMLFYRVYIIMHISDTFMFIWKLFYFKLNLMSLLNILNVIRYFWRGVFPSLKTLIYIKKKKERKRTLSTPIPRSRGRYELLKCQYTCLLTYHYFDYLWYGNENKNFKPFKVCHRALILIRKKYRIDSRGILSRKFVTMYIEFIIKWKLRRNAFSRRNPLFETRRSAHAVEKFSIDVSRV